MADLKEHRYLKWLLILQSFLPLYLLLFIKYTNREVFCLAWKFIVLLVHLDFSVFLSAVRHESFIRAVLVFACILFMLMGTVTYLFFTELQTSGFIDNGEKVRDVEDTTDSSIAFFVTYIIPLVMDSVGQWRDFLCFVIVMAMMIMLMRNTNLYYQNPLLTVLGYRTFKFRLEETDVLVLAKGELIGITRGNFDPEKVIKRKYISDNVFLVYNKN